MKGRRLIVLVLAILLFQTGRAQYVFLDGHVDGQALFAGSATYRDVDGKATGNLSSENGLSSIYGY